MGTNGEAINHVTEEGNSTDWIKALEPQGQMSLWRERFVGSNVLKHLAESAVSASAETSAGGTETAETALL